MLVNYVRGEECRIAIVEDGKLEEFYSERASADLHVGNIYRGKVTNVEPSIQAAFIDFGLERSGFLHITDLHPRYFPGEKKEELEAVGQKTPRRDRPPIQQCLRRGQEILVQVLKEGIGSKGPTLTSYISIPGRFIVLMPFMERHGVSRKIEDMDQRRQMHQLLDELNPPENIGVIVRTAGLERPKTELKRELAYMLRLWKDIEHRMSTGRGAAELYVESDLVTRTLRDVITSDLKRVVIDDREVALRAKQFLRLAMPRSSIKVIHYKDPVPLFDAFDIERQIQSIHNRIVPLPSGGSLVFDTTEAMVAIDVNSGKSRDSADAETNAYRTNLEAVEEIARQLRLRDLGGLIVLDLIDMYKLQHRRAVEKKFKEQLKKDRARTKDLRISELGMLEMTRQRMRPSLKKSVFRECPTCHGAGLLMSIESVVLSAMRRIAMALHTAAVHRVEVTASAEVLTALLNRRREMITRMEQSSGRRIAFSIDSAAGPDTVSIRCFDEKNAQIDLARLPVPKSPELTEVDEIQIDDLRELNEPFEEFEEEPEELVKEPQPDAGLVALAAAPTADTAPADTVQPAGSGRRRRRRRGRRGRGRGGQPEAAPTVDNGQPVAPISTPVQVQSGYEGAAAVSPAAAFPDSHAGGAEAQPISGETSTSPSQDPGRRRRRRRRGGRRHRRRRDAPAGGAGGDLQPPPEAPATEPGGGSV